MHSNPKNYSQLQPEERVTLASLKQQNYSIRAMARVLGRCASTIHQPRAAAQQRPGPVRQRAAGLQRQATEHCRAHAPEHDLRSGPGCDIRHCAPSHSRLFSSLLNCLTRLQNHALELVTLDERFYYAQIQDCIDLLVTIATARMRSGRCLDFYVHRSTEKYLQN